METVLSTMNSDGDEHPNQTGNQKATGEFVNMLNIFYNQWIATAPESPQTNFVEDPSVDMEEEISEKMGQILSSSN